jgi:ATP-dependent Lon protease
VTKTLSLPVIPLRQAVLFPGVTVPIAAGRPGTLAAIEAALSDPDRVAFVSAQREDGETATPEILHTIGTIARIVQVQRGPSGMQLVLHGERRAIALRIAEHDNYLVATVRDAEEMSPLDAQAPTYLALVRELRERAVELGTKTGFPREAIQRFMAEVSDPGQFADVVATHLDLSVTDRQALLETLSVEDRLRRVLLLLQRQLAVLDAQEDIKSKVQEELGGRQREFYLREQLKAIQKELGEGDKGNDPDALREKLAALPLPEAARKEVDRELSRLDRASGESMEGQVIRTYLETIAELPWGKRSEEKLDLAHAAEVLERDHYGLGDVKDRILEFLAVRSLRRKGEAAEQVAPAAGVITRGRAPIMLFVGPPGVGKTSVARSIAAAMGREYVRISLGGVRDEADIRGHRRTYVGAMPGRIIQGMKQAGTANPVFLLDEVDKLGVSYQGDPSAALLEVLDPAQNDTFTDHYLGVPFDLSEVLFIATANFIQNIPGPLLDRMEVVEFSGYTEKEKLEIARRFLVPRQLSEAGFADGQLTLTDEALAATITGYTREAGVRQLEREIGRLARKVARRLAAGEIEGAALDAAEAGRLLGRAKVHPEHAAVADQVGVATGMYYTPVGGDIMFVEASTMRGKGELVLTGQLGDVMKESARAAWSYARAHAEDLGIDEGAFERDVHVHVPAGAIPKDGPSAGVTMSVALVSALAGRPARHDLAMTGEITLSGRVLPIGGVKEKVLGAVRAGITTILLPKANETDLEDLPSDVRMRLEVLTVDHLDEVLALALRGASLHEGRLTFAEVAEAGRPVLDTAH